MKFLRITMPDGSRWDVPAQIIAERMSELFMKPPGDDAILLEFVDSYLKWEEISKCAVEVRRRSPTDYREEFEFSDREIIEKEQP